VGFLYRLNHVCASFVALTTVCGSLAADEPLDVNGYVQVVLRAHPSARQTAGLQAAADAERRAARLFPDPFLSTRGAADAVRRPEG
jgi:hypothetical protein